MTPLGDPDGRLAMSAPVRTVTGSNFAILADCHIHPGGGPEFPPHVLAALGDAHLIVVLGDMGDSAGLDQLEEIAPLVGVRGADDADDPRTCAGALVLEAGALRIGCVFNAKEAGLATSISPFVAAPDIAEVSRRLFGSEVDVLLHASTHKPSSDGFGDGRLALNPGSAILPDEGAPPTFARLLLDGEGYEPEIVLL
jgi:predicted phosphodiesterase